jgi:hypothetical protein
MVSKPRETVPRLRIIPHCMFISDSLKYRACARMGFRRAQPILQLTLTRGARLPSVVLLVDVLNTQADPERAESHSFPQALSRRSRISLRGIPIQSGR